MKRKKLFCELGPTAYKISLMKQILTRKLKNLITSEKFARTYGASDFPVSVYSSSCHMIKKGPGIDPKLQYNKAENIRIACNRIDRLIIKPGETFSFWNRVGNTSARNGFLEGRILMNGKIVAGYGGGLCNLANSLHLAVMHSPMTITELHHHSDALAPDENGVRVPYSAGTSVNYNFIDFKFRNDTDQPVQLIARCEGETLIVGLNSGKEFPTKYRIVEEGHHFCKEDNGNYYRKSKIYRETLDRESEEVLSRDLKWDNRSKVLFDPDLIPAELLR